MLQYIQNLSKIRFRI